MEEPTAAVGLLVAMIGSRSPEVWMALLAGAIYVWRKSATKGILMRSSEALISGLLGFSVGPDASIWSGANVAISTLLITTLGYLVLDALTSIVADRAVFREILIRYLGGKSNGDSKDV